MREIVVIIGEKRVGKTYLFNYLVKALSLKKKSELLGKKYSPIVNYKEATIIVDGSIYSLIDTPS